RHIISNPRSTSTLDGENGDNSDNSIPSETPLEMTTFRRNFENFDNSILNITPVLPEISTPGKNNFILNETPVLHEIATPKGNFDSYTCIDNVILNVTPILHEISTPALSDVGFGESVSCETPILHEISTPVLSEVGIWENENGEGSICCSDEEINLNDILLSQKYMSEEFLDKNDIDHQEVSQVIRQIRVKNINRVIIGHLNVNFMAPKLDAIRTIIPGNVDIMVFSETKLDNSYPTTQL
ncbi:MAG: hypothetical protein MK216_04090, partial [Candidatus Nitrosopelagicus sp.]|nr:hypothetical protein [Candidatus Nitrosopelagicus sp.]